MAEKIHTVCPHCDQVNRIRVDRSGDAARCGQCKRPLFDGRPAPLSGASFDRHILRSDVPILVDFWARWCGPCLQMAPQFEDAARRLEPRVRLAKVDTEQDPALAARYSVRAIPTLILFQGGRERARISGAMPAEQLVQWVGQQL